ncbi:MAG: GNAT family N-acetyltransferase [Phycisphaerales bacterium]
MEPSSPHELPAGLPIPKDDGAALHLLHAALPAVTLPSTAGAPEDLAALTRGPTVIFIYPRTGIPGQPPSPGFSGEDWDSIPGARGCTPQSCGFRDLFGDFAALGIQVRGLSTNTTAHQREFKARTGTPVEFLSDVSLALTSALRLPTFRFPVESGGSDTLLHRMAWYCEGGHIRRVWYPVFPPDRSAADVLAWCRQRAAIELSPITAADAAFVLDELKRHWGGPEIWSLGRMIRADRIDGRVARVAGEPAGLITWQVDAGGYQCEVVTLSTRLEGRGVGEHLLEGAVDAGRDAGCSRAYLTTTNDNLRALGFYQKRGWRLAALHRASVDEARARHPVIPAVGLGGIPLRDELELEMWLRPPAIRLAEEPPR